MLLAVDELLLVAQPLDLRVGLGAQLALDAHALLDRVTDDARHLEQARSDQIALGHRGLFALKLKQNVRRALAKLVHNDALVQAGVLGFRVLYMFFLLCIINSFESQLN